MPEDNRRVSRWIENHLRVAIVPWEDRDSLERVEQAEGSPPELACQAVEEARYWIGRR